MRINTIIAMNIVTHMSIRTNTHTITSMHTNMDIVMITIMRILTTTNIPTAMAAAI
ncbi:hypothetical protein AGMMS4952_04220 [Spirochaetia bacterium]|nr:hypothetical protein AGMMS4952_04220 [Spirochaetia bacterium]